MRKACYWLVGCNYLLFVCCLVRVDCSLFVAVVCRLLFAVCGLLVAVCCCALIVVCDLLVLLSFGVDLVGVVRCM